MKKLINKKSLLILLNILLILTCTIYYAINNNRKFSNSIKNEEKLEGVEEDNWELSIVYYDSTVDNGNTPLTEINWNAVDRNENRIIKIQINYKNTNVQNKYDPHKIKILVNKLRGRNRGNSGEYQNGMPIESVSAGLLSNGYDWFSSSTQISGIPYVYFINNETIEEHSNLEGSIQIVYNLKPFYHFRDLFNDPTHDDIYASAFLNTEPEIIQAKLTYGDKEVVSNEITFNFNAEKEVYGVAKTVSKVSALDGFENPNDYIWVKYTARVTRSGNHPRTAHYLYFVEEVPEGSVAYDENMHKLEVVNNKFVLQYQDEEYVESSSFMYGNADTYFIGYPKATLEGQTITSTVKAYGTYDDETEPSLIAEDSKTIDLSDYEYVLPEVLYKISSSNTSIYGGLVKYGYDTSNAYIDPKVIYTGTKYDLIVQSDYFLIPTDDGTYKKIDDNQHNITFVSVGSNGYMGNGNGAPIIGNEIDVYVRHANSTEYIEYPEKMVLGSKMSISFADEDIVDVKLIIKDLECGINWGSITYNDKLYASDIAETGRAYRYVYMQVKQGDEIVNTPTSASAYNGLAGINNIDLAQYDLDTYGMYMQRGYNSIEIKPNTMKYSVTSGSASVTDKPSEERFLIKYKLKEYVDYYYALSNGFYGTELYDLLPEGMDIVTTEEEIRDLVQYQLQNSYKNRKYKLVSGTTFNSSPELWEYFNNHLIIDIIKNYNNTNRTLLKIKTDFSDDPFIISPAGREYSYPNSLYYDLTFEVSYDNFVEYGNEWVNPVYGYILNQENMDYILKYGYSSEYYGNDTNDINGNGITDETYFVYNPTAIINTAIETHQDVQTSVQSELSNYATGNVKVTKNGEYTYKLRVRTGQNNITNLIIYDSIEDYAKNGELETIQASGGKQYWQGEFLGVDTTYAESKGYTIEVYYNENPNPGSLTEDNTWQEYTDSTDNSLVKAVAFKYLDAEGNPAILPANTNTYVLLKMKSPNEDYITYSYNGCWTEWNAIDSVTGRPVDFITGINSNIVKLALPTSAELVYRDITLEKEWIDNNNALGLRPQTIKYNLIPNSDATNTMEVTLTGEGNTWSTTVSVPATDVYGVPILYEAEEQAITLENNEYRYIAELTDTYEYTNTLYKNVTLTKLWKDNKNAYLTRPSSVTFQVKQNGNNFKTETFSGILTADGWGLRIGLPVYDNNGNEYTYTIDEVSVEGYTSSCTEFTCTNTLTGTENIVVKKVWEDSNNDYETRPSSIDIKLKQDNNDYQTVTLSGNSNTWESDTITVPKYNSEGVKYTYTISETPLEEYGLVTYNQANYQVTNTLKKNIVITVTKNWIDGSNEQGLRPDSLTINLLRNNVQYQELTLTGTGDTWSTTIEVPKYDDNQHLYTYSIQELTDDLNEDYSNITYSEQELSVTNKLEKKINIKISKIWDDGDNELLTRPESLNINLLRNGDLYQELTLTPENVSDNTWELNIEDLDAYDATGALYSYTIEENLIEQLSRYETITYDQTNYTITNKLTIPPKVTLYFTVKNGYIPNGSDEIQYDEEGYNNVLSSYNLNGDDEYTFSFELENVDTGEVIKGKLSTQGVLEFDDVPYGTYRAREGEDKYFDFVSMVEITQVLGVTFTQDEKGGTITISPTGQDIVYGAHITNKIEYAKENPNTLTSKSYLFFYILLIAISTLIGIYFYKRYKFIK